MTPSFESVQTSVPELAGGAWSTPATRMTPLYWFIRLLIRVAARILLRFEVHGVDLLPTSGGFLLVANHASNLDPPLIAAALSRPCHTLAKRELFDVPVLGWLIRRLHAHPIQRGGVDRRALRECLELLRRGDILLLFPEGTRTRDGELQTGKAGAAMLAAQAQVPIVPAYIDGTFRALPRGAKRLRFAKIRVYFGKPFAVSQVVPAPTEGRQAYDLLAVEIMRRIAELAPRS